MGKSSGSVRTVKNGGIGKDGGGDFKGEIKNQESISKIKNTELRREIQQGISKYESRMGVRQTNVKLATLSGSVGVHVTRDGISEAVYLNKAMFKNASVKDIVTMKQSAYKSGFLTKTNKPVQHTIVHELSHAQWNVHLKGASQKAAGVVVQKKYKEFLKDFSKGTAKGYGRYSITNVNEFWAEASTKAVLGKSDKYTRFVKSTIKKYKL